MQRPPKQISPVESHLAYWVHYVAYRLDHELRLRTRQFGVTAAEWVVLRKLHENENGETATSLAWLLGLSRGYLSRLALRLEAKGLIHRDKPDSDRRTLTLTLTDTARRLLPHLAAAADRTNARNLAGAGEAAHETIERVMKWIVHRHRFRFVPAARCRMRKYRVLDLDLI